MLRARLAVVLLSFAALALLAPAPAAAETPTHLPDKQEDTLNLGLGTLCLPPSL